MRYNCTKICIMHMHADMHVHTSAQTYCVHACTQMQVHVLTYSCPCTHSLCTLTHTWTILMCTCTHSTVDTCTPTPKLAFTQSVMCMHTCINPCWHGCELLRKDLAAVTLALCLCLWLFSSRTHLCHRKRSGCSVWSPGREREEVGARGIQSYCCK